MRHPVAHTILDKSADDVSGEENNGCEPRHQTQQVTPWRHNPQASTAVFATVKPDNLAQGDGGGVAGYRKGISGVSEVSKGTQE